MRIPRVYISLTFFFILLGLTLFVYAQTDEPTTKLNDEIIGQNSEEKIREEEQTVESEVPDIPEFPQLPDENTIEYMPGDWTKYIWYDRYLKEYNTLPPKEQFIAEGLIFYQLGIGSTHFTDTSYITSDITQPKSRVIDSGITQNRIIQLHLEGQVNDRVRVYIHHDSTADEKDNIYIVEYKAIEDDEILREAHIGNILVSVNNSKYAVYDSGSRRALGFDTTFQKDDLRVKMFGSIFEAESEEEHFTGSKAAGNTVLREYQYLKNRYYQIEPFIRYDNAASPPLISSASNAYENLITFSSAPADPSSYRPYAVNIEPGSFSLYYDDQIMTNNEGSQQLQLDGGMYTKLASGRDYRINFLTGEIEFLIDPLPDSRIYALYTLSNGRSSADPSVRTDVFPGKNFVFIKYGTALSEDPGRDYSWDSDKNGDGVLNYDIYERRSVYFTGSKRLSEEDFNLTIMKERSPLTSSERAQLGKYQVEFDSGLISFYLREPFRPLLDQRTADKLYTESVAGDAYRYSLISLYLNYYSGERSYQLKHTNIVEESVIVRVNGRKIDSSLYTLDAEDGLLEFDDPNNPYIGDNTTIEIRYEYAPFAGGANAFLGGFRTDYKINHNLSVGGTLLYSTSPMVETIPSVGNEPEANLVLEADSTVYFGPAKLKRLASRITGKPVRNMPFDFNGYYEIAHSRLQTNTFGKAMVEDMEESEEITSVPLSEKEWILSSLPSDFTQQQRAKLFYKYYRPLSALDTLKGEEFSPYEVDYSTKPGPYNIAESHQEEADLDGGQSLVLDFNFESGDRCASVVTRKLADGTLDFSGLQYVEFYYKAAEGNGQVRLSVDVGKINEDSDGDSILDTEDTNLNNVLDYDPDRGVFEDRGYLFNPAGEEQTRVGSGPRLSSETKGDGVLTSEDINRNGMLDTLENVITFPGVSERSAAYIDGNPSLTNLTVNLADSGWKKAVIYLDRKDETLSSSAISCLSSVNAIRVNVESDSQQSGIIYISGIKFIESSWKDIRINGVRNEDPERFKVSLVDSYNDTEYRENSFLQLSPEDYKNLYGTKELEEKGNPREGALNIEYSSLGGGNGSVIKHFARALNLMHYKSMHFWVNVRDFTIGDTLQFKVGSTEDDYIMYEFPIDHKDVWKRLSIKLGEESNSALVTSEIVGSPDLMHIKNVTVQINGNSGRLWLNNIYVADPMELTDLAYWAEGELTSRKPVYRAAGGDQYGRDFKLKYIKRGVGRDFVSPGRIERNMSEDAHEFYTSIYPFPYFYSGLSYIRELNRTDDINEDFAEELWGKTIRQTTIFDTAYTPPQGLMPTILTTHKITNYDNWHNTEIAEELFDKQTDRNDYAPSIVIEKRISDFLFGSLYSRIASDFLFSTQRVSTDPQLSESLTEPDSTLKRYQTQENNFSLEYDNNYFFLRPSLSAGSGEYVTWKGFENSSEQMIQDELRSNFHFPYFYSGRNMKYFQRNHSASHTTGVKIAKFFIPEHTLSAQYSESEFSDYQDDDQPYSYGYQRKKGAETRMNQLFYFPFSFNSSSSIIRNITFSYQRESSLSESGVPYEGETTDITDEKFGIRRTMPATSTAYNVFTLPPWLFFTGRNNFANGRDHVYETLNRPITVGDETVQTYYNGFLVKDSYSLTSYYDLEAFSISTTTLLSQLSERSDIETVPQQLVSTGAGIDFYFDLMEIFGFGFFRPNAPGKNRHSAQFSTGLMYTKNMFITSNLGEDVYSPTAGFTFGINRRTLTLRSGIDLMFRKDEIYIPTDADKRYGSDDKYFENLPGVKLDEFDASYNYLVEYTTEVGWLYSAFSRLYRLYAYPMFTLSYELLLNRYDYEYTVSPEPYDMHLVTGNLDMDVHKNIKGNVTGRWALEKFRNRESGNVYQEIISYEILFGLSIVF